MRIRKKSQIWISVIIYTLVSVLALVLILNTGIPILTEMKDRAVFSKIKDVMLDLDRHITEIANQGEGSQATVSFEIRDGEVLFSDDQLIWELETKSKIVSPRTKTVLGNLIISSNANVRTYELSDSYMMNTTLEDDSFSVKINKNGTASNWIYYNTSEIIEYIQYKDYQIDGSKFNFNLNNNITSAQGTGYIEMVPAGNNTNLGRAKVIAHMNSTFAVYDLEFTLESYSDFVTVRVKNFESK